MEKQKIIDAISGALDGGADAIYEALVSEGYIEPEGDDAGSEPAGDEPEPKEDEPAPSPFGIDKKDNAGASRKKAAGFAFNLFGKK